MSVFRDSSQLHSMLKQVLHCFNLLHIPFAHHQNCRAVCIAKNGMDMFTRSRFEDMWTQAGSNVDFAGFPFSAAQAAWAVMVGLVGFIV